MQPTEDSALLRQYAESHSEDAFATLVARHVNLVYSVALRHAGDPHHAEEITQAVFIILAKSVAAIAAAKGAAAGGSTLTLIKGALRIEVWTWGELVGEGPVKDVFGRERKPIIWDEPWQLSNIDPKAQATKN